MVEANKINPCAEWFKGPEELLEKVEKNKEELSQLLQENVIAKRKELCWKLFDLSVSLHHISDWLTKEERQKCERLCQSLLIFANLANSFKHVGLDMEYYKWRKNDVLIDKDSSLEISASGSTVDDMLPQPLRVKVTLKDGNRINIEEEAEKSIKFWREYFSKRQ